MCTTRPLLLLVTTAMLVVLVPGARRTAAPASPGRRPVYFEANRGQADESVRFLSRGPGFTLLLASNEAIVTTGRATGGAPEGDLSLKLVGADPQARTEGVEELPGKVHYLLGKDPRGWRTNIAAYRAVRYDAVYPGVDLVFHTGQQELEYDFVLAPGADPSAIGLALGGADWRLDERGDLVARSSHGELRHRRPVAYQDVEGERKEVPAAFAVDHDGVVRFQVADYDRDRALVLDPVLVYSTYLGGAGGEIVTALATDASGHLYVGGSTGAGSFPTTEGAYDSSFNGPTRLDGAQAEGFVAKLAPDGTLVYSTFLGGSADEAIEGLALDAEGNAYVTGFTLSSDFPTTAGAYDTSLDAPYRDAFVSKLSADGASLTFSTLLGGRLHDEGFAIALDAAGDIHLGGRTSSADFPVTAGVVDSTLDTDASDGFLAGITSDGTRLLYASYLGGVDFDEVAALALDGEGRLYVTGHTSSPDYPTTAGAFDTSPNGASDVFVTKLAPGASALLYSTLLGGPAHDRGRSIAVDTQGHAFVAGQAQSHFPTTPGAFDTAHNSPGAEDFFVVKLDPAGGALVYGTYLGGDGWDYGSFLHLATDGSVFVTGRTSSANMPVTPDAFQPSLANCCVWDDLYVAHLDAAGQRLLYGSYLGGRSDEGGFGVTTDPFGNLYLIGETRSRNFPTTRGAIDRYLAGYADGTITRFSLDVPVTPCTLEVRPRWAGDTLQLGFVLGTGTGRALRWDARTVTTTGIRELSSTWQPVVDPPQAFDVPVGGPVGVGWVETKLVDTDGNVVCSDRAAIPRRGR